jgi:hypothetical protein
MSERYNDRMQSDQNARYVLIVAAYAGHYVSVELTGTD